MEDLSVEKLKILAGSLIVEDEELDPNEKLALLKLVEIEDSAHQLMSMMLVGEHFNPSSRSEELMLEGRFVFSNFYDLLQEAPYGSIAGMMVFNPNIWASYRAIGKRYTVARRRCQSIKNTRARGACRATVKISSIRKKLDLMKRATSDCSKAKDPGSCRRRASRAIDKQRERLKKAQARFVRQYGTSARA